MLGLSGVERKETGVLVLNTTGPCCYEILAENELTNAARSRGSSRDFWAISMATERTQPGYLMTMLELINMSQLRSGLKKWISNVGFNLFTLDVSAYDYEACSMSWKG